MTGMKIREIFLSPSLQVAVLRFLMASRKSVPSPTVAFAAKSRKLSEPYFAAVIAFNSAVTFCALPGPKIICHSEPTTATPLTPSTASRSSFVKCSSLTEKRKRVIQLYGAIMLSAGPMCLYISSAVSL